MNKLTANINLVFTYLLEIPLYNESFNVKKM